MISRENATQWTVAEVAALVKGTPFGDKAVTVSGVADVEQAEPGDLVFAESERYLRAALRSRAAAILTVPEAEAIAAESGKPLILVENPRLAFVRVLEAMAPPLAAPPGAHPTAQVGANVRLGQEVSLAAYVTVGERATLGDRVVVLAGARIGADCVIGDETVIYPNAVLYPGVTVGKRCLLHAGCVIGADGFGYVPLGGSLRKAPHIGTVEIGDEVEIGANACIDRAKTGATIIGSGTKIDNLVHVAHNVRIGQSCLLIAQTGIAGSVTVGNGVILAGQAGIKDHVTLGDGARIGAQGGVVGDVPAGATYSGYPARPHAEKMREYAALAMLPDYLKRIRALEKRLAELEKQAE